MFDTTITIVGNVVSQPERRRLESGATVVNFRIASTSRRYDKETDRWVDGDSLFVKVACWRQLGDHVYQSIFQGDPIIVHGRMYTRRYEVDGDPRWSYELDATAVGHDLSRGVATFKRKRKVGSTDVTGDAMDFAGASTEADGSDPAGQVSGAGHQLERPESLPEVDEDDFDDLDLDADDLAPVGATAG